MSDSFQTWLVREIHEVLGRSTTPPPMMIWCDPDRSWLDLLRAATKETDFELWAPEPGEPDPHELVLRSRFFSEAKAPRIIWVAHERHGISWFKPFELEAQEIWEKSLLQALREYGVDISRDHEADLVGLLPAHAREWFDKPKETWKELTPGNAKGALVDDQRMLQVLAGGDGEFQRLHDEDRFEIFGRRAKEDFGLPVPQITKEQPWRVAATAHLLCTEAAEATPQDPPREPDKIISAGLARNSALRLLKQWQHDIRYIGSFEKLVPQAEATIGLTYWARNLPKMPRSKSSKAVEDTLFLEAADRLDRLEDVDALAAELDQDIQSYKDRQNGFWGRDATSPVGWRFLVELGQVASLLVESREVETDWSKLSDAINWYTERGWHLDRAGEQLFKESADLPKQLHRVRARLRRGYLRTMDRIGRKYSELLARKPDSAFDLPTAGEAALAELEREQLPTALFFVDACRFDLGQRIAEQLNQGEPSNRATVASAVAPVPSITALGMSLALPAKRDKFRVQLSDDGKFEIYIDGFDGDLKWAEQRRKWLAESFEVKDWYEIEDVLDGETLKKASRTRRIIAVHGKEFDSHDGMLEVTGADAELTRYVRAIRKLRDAGFNRVIVVSDHGFFHWQPEENEVEDELPSGDIIWKHRRAMVGTELSHSTAIHLKVLQSSLEVMVPRSTDAFRTYGALGFFHGGATLQEMVIPVVVATWPAKAKKVQVVLKPVGHIASESPRIQVQSASTGQLFNVDATLMSRRVLVKIKDPESGRLIFRHEEPVSIEPEGESHTINLALVEPRPELSYGTDMIVEVLDADDEELLGREEVQLKIEITDW